MTDLTVLCVTQNAPHAAEFLLLMADVAETLDAAHVVYDGAGAGCIEAVLDDAVAGCDTDYVLRLDDDETVSRDLMLFLAAREYRTADHWCFPRRHLWPDADSFIVTPPLWPDLQTRLSVRAKAGGRRTVHVGSPFGAGRLASAPIDHHKFLVRTEAERRELVAHYERLQPGAGSDHYAAFSVPEDLEAFEVAECAPLVLL